MKILLCFYLILTILAFSNTLEIDIIKKLENKYNQITTIKCDFVQTYTNVGYEKGIVYKGKAYLKKGGKLRWDYETPEKKLIVSDGKTLWLYRKEDNELLTQDNFDLSSRQAGISFLWGKGNLKKDFTIKIIGSRKDFYVLDLTPKEESSDIRNITFTIYKEDFLIYMINMLDLLGNENKIEFSKIQINKKLKDNLFKIK